MADDSNDDKGNKDGGAAAIKELLTPMVDSIKEIQDGMKGFATELETIKEGQKPIIKDPEDDDKDKPIDLDERKLETMSRKEFLDLIDERTGKKVDTATKPITEKVDDGQSKGLEEDVNKAVEKAASGHKDFWEWKEEMGKELKKNPYLWPEDAYTLAKAKSPEKVAEMKEKYLSEDEKTQRKTAKEKVEAEKRGDPLPFALTPTSGKTVASDKMSMVDASNIAWEETMSGTEGK